MRSRVALLALAVAACGGPRRQPPPLAGSLAIETEGESWIRVGGAALLDAGLDPFSDPATLGLSRRGVPVAIRVVPAGARTMAGLEAIEFWAWSADSLYDRRDTWILAPAADPLRIDEVAPPRVPGPAPALFARARAGTETYYAMSALNGDESNWFWDFVFANGAAASKTFVVPLERPAASGTARVTAALHGYTYFDEIAPDHHVRLSIAGTPAADVTSDGNAPLTITADVPASLLDEQTGVEIALDLPLDVGAAFETVLVRSFSIDYPRRPVAAGTGLHRFRVAGAGTLALDGFDASTEAFDVTDPAVPRRVSRAAAAAAAIPPPPPDGGGTDEPPPAPSLEVTVTAEADLAIVPPGAKAGPLAVRALRGADPFADVAGADLLIVTPGALAPAADRLAQHRRSTGVTVRVVRWEDVVDHAGGGYADPRALRDLLSRARAEWTPAPKWVLLFGDASYDPRGVNPAENGAESNLIPAAFGDTPFLETPTDNAAVAAGPRARPDLAIGRIPARDVAEADAVVDKILAYETSPSPEDDVLLLADDAQASWEYSLFVATSDQIALEVGPPFTTAQMYLAGDVAAVRTSLFDALGAGAAWVNFMGHGNFSRWATEGVLLDTDIASLPERDVLPIYSAANCLTAHWTHPDSELRELGERLLLEPRRGAVAVFGSTALVYPEGQAELTLALTGALLVDGDATLGDALVLAKSLLDPSLSAHGDLLASWTLLGDPSMRVRRP